MSAEFSLKNRMLGYEDITKSRLMRRTPVVIRLDGVAFHTFTKGFNKPFDAVLLKTMQQTMQRLCETVENCVLGYTQSDEISLVLCDYKDITTDAWYSYEVEKLVSVTASLSTLFFNSFFMENVAACKETECYYMRDGKIKSGYFDSRAFNLPVDEVNNYLVYRQQDAIRNSIQMVAQAQFKQSELNGLNSKALQDKLYTDRGITWNDFAIAVKRGTCCIKKSTAIISNGTVKLRDKWYIDADIPEFSQDTNYVNKLVRFDLTD